MERAIALAQDDVIALDDLPPTLRGDYAEVVVPSFERSESLRTWAIRYARLMLGRCAGNRREAARILGISYHTLVTYLRAYDEEVSGVESREKAGGEPGREPELTAAK